MTHEHKLDSEIGGPENDNSLPKAEDIPVYDDPEEAFADALPSD